MDTNMITDMGTFIIMLTTIIMNTEKKRERKQPFLTWKPISWLKTKGWRWQTGNCSNAKEFSYLTW